jgi:hypothetical protein
LSASCKNAGNANSWKLSIFSLFKEFDLDPGNRRHLFRSIAAIGQRHNNNRIGRPNGCFQ